MQKFLPLLFSLLQIAALAQTDTSRWTLGLNLGISRSGCIIHPESSVKNLSNTLDSIETGHWFTNIGVRCGLRLTPKLQLLTGIELDKYGHAIDSLPEAQLHTIRYQYTNIGVALGFQYDILQHQKLQPYLGLQLQPSKLIAQQWSYYQFSSNEKHIEKTKMDLNPYQLQINVFAGVRIPLNLRFNLNLSASYQRNIISLSESPIQRYYQKIGLCLGLSKSI